MSTQVQRRRGTKAENDTFTGAAGEIVYLTDTNQLVIHNGSTQGGFVLPNELDVVNDYFGYASASGTDTITLTVLAAITAYQAGQMFTFKAAATNTSTATLNVNTLGAKTIKKKDTATGTIITLVAGDIIAGGLYKVIYDGADFQLISTDGGGIADVSQGDLNTSSGTISGNINFSTPLVGTLPGGSYGFNPESKITVTTGSNSINDVIASTSYEQRISVSTDGTNRTATVKQTYVTASPPFDMGDGEVGGFIFMEVNKSGDIIRTYAADVPPWAYNGKTRIVPDRIDRLTGKKYLIKKEYPNPEDFFNKKDIKPIEKEIEITQEIKNADMGDIPNPFGKPNKGNTIILLDPMCPKVKLLIDMQNSGEEIEDYLDCIAPDNEALVRKGPLGVKQVKYKTDIKIAKKRRKLRNK